MGAQRVKSFELSQEDIDRMREAEEAAILDHVPTFDEVKALGGNALQETIEVHIEPR